MADAPVAPEVLAHIEAAVAAYTSRREDFANLADRLERELIQNHDLRRLIHSTKRREKDPSHLHDKLLRRCRKLQEKDEAFDVTADNVFEKIDDLAGVRLLHIHTEQLKDIHPIILKVLATYKYKPRAKPVVYIWDVERREFFKHIGLKVTLRPLLYTSVHYVVQPHYDAIGCELQVRTLAEELWGEVSHTIDYPHPTESIACREQLAALARVASGCTRLVDSIFTSLAAFRAEPRVSAMGADSMAIGEARIPGADIQAAQDSL
jgi:putative GTP pyrophosphokinase